MSRSAGTRQMNNAAGKKATGLPPVQAHVQRASGCTAPGSPIGLPDIGWTAAGKRVHLIGVGGCGMCGAAAVLRRRAALVSGSDATDSAALMQLAGLGVNVHVGQQATNLPGQCDLVVHSAAIKESNPELRAARERGLRVVKYSQLLGLLMGESEGIAIAGTHGKSTTSAMVSFVLREAGLDPSFVIGAGVEQLGGGSGVGSGQQFVVEACEYDRSYHNLRPRIATILNIEEDHLDYYKDLNEIVESFRAFARLVPPDGLLVVNADNRESMQVAADAACKVETFGFGDDADWRAHILETAHGRCRFEAWHKGQRIVEVVMAIPGRHHVCNAMAAIAVCSRCGVGPEAMAKAIGKFKGAERRLTERGQVAGVTVVDDYAHHPTEIQVTLKAAREFYAPRRMYVVFQPHQHSRTRFLLNDFARSFGSADTVIVPDIYFVRDSESERELIAATDLVKQIHLNGGEARYEPDFPRIVEQLCAEVRQGDLVVTMGAGNVWRVADDLVACLSRTREDSDEQAQPERAEL